VAQLEAQLISTQWVGGSSPSGGVMDKNILALIQCYEFVEKSTKVTLYIKLEDNYYKAKDLYDILRAGGRVAEGTGLQNPRGNSSAGSNPVSPS
jgi:hypothetical protein